MEVREAKWSDVALAENHRNYDTAGSDFADDLDEATRYGLWFHDAGYDQVPEPGLTVEAAEERAMLALSRVWETCAERVSGFPSDVDPSVAQQVKGGIVKMLVIPE